MRIIQRNGFFYVYNAYDVMVACFKSMYMCLKYYEVLNAMEKSR